MGWDQFDTEGASGAFVKLNIDDTVQVVVVALNRYFDKTWPGGSIERCVEFEVVDALDGEAKTLDAGVRRAQPLNIHRREIEARGLRIEDRITQIECYAEAHPTRPGARIGRWRCSDLGPATAGRAGDDPIDAIRSAATVDALKTAFGAAWQATADKVQRERLKSAYDARKEDLAMPDAGDVPF